MRWMVILILIFAFSLSLLAETVILKDGTRIEGKLLSNTPDGVIIRVGNELKQIPQKDVEKIIMEEVRPTAAAAKPTVEDALNALDSANIAILWPRSKSRIESTDPNKPPSRDIVVEGAVWTAEAEVKVRVSMEGRVFGPVDAKLTALTGHGERAIWKAPVTLFRGSNIIQALAAVKNGRTQRCTNKIYLDPIFSKPLPKELKGKIPLSFTVMDEDDISKLEIRIDGKTVAETNSYMWDTNSYSGKSPKIEYFVEYKTGDKHTSSPPMYREAP